MRGAHPLLPLLVVLPALLACHSNERGAPLAAAEQESAGESALREQVRRSAREYPAWGALDTALRVAPTDCRMPRIMSRGPLTISLAESGPHALKLYKLHARDPSAYRGVESGAAQRGQVIVKEAFAAEPFQHQAGVEPPKDVVWTPDGMQRAGSPAGLFMMLRDADAAPGEAAWTYATVDAAGTITGLGRLDSCIRCHERAPYDGLHGLSRSG